MFSDTFFIFNYNESASLNNTGTPTKITRTPFLFQSHLTLTYCPANSPRQSPHPSHTAAAAGSYQAPPRGDAESPDYVPGAALAAASPPQAVCTAPRTLPPSSVSPIFKNMIFVF